MIMNRFTQNASQGFTIVELLIVIVVIGILAAITLNTYNGIQDTAYNIKIVSGVTQFRDAAELYKIKQGNYPRTTREIDNQSIAMACLGTGYPSGFCGKITGVDTYEDSAFNTELAKAATGSAISITNLSVGPESFTGAAYGIDTVDLSKSSTGFARTIQYALRGNNTPCKIPTAWSYQAQISPPVTACEIILEPVPAR